MPSPDQLTGDGWQTLPNYSLTPEKSKTFEMGADVTWEYVDLGLTYFHTQWVDKIIGIQTAPNQWINQNLDGATIAGLELALSVDVGAALQQEFSLSPFVNLTWLTTRKNKDNVSVAAIGSDTLINTPEMSVSYGLDFDHPGYDLTAHLGATYFSETITRDWRTGSPTNGLYVINDSDTVVDLSLEKKLFDICNAGAVKLRAEVNNVFDSDNEFYMDYPGPGRNFYLGLKYVY